MLRDILSSQNINPAFMKRMSELKQASAQVAQKLKENKSLSDAEKANEELLKKLKEGDEKGQELIKQLKDNEKNLKNNTKAMAKERLARLKEYLKVIRNIYMGDPKRLAKEIHNITKEIRDIAKQYKEGMKDSAISDVPNIPEAQNKATDKAVAKSGSGEPTNKAEGEEEAKIEAVSPKEESPKISETPEAKAAKAYADTLKAEAEMEKKAEEKDLEGFVVSIKAMVAKMKQILKNDISKEQKREFEELDKELAELTKGQPIRSISVTDMLDI